MTAIKQLRLLAAIWGTCGVVLLLSFPIYRLSGMAWQGLSNTDMQWFHWLLLAVNIVFMAYSEGYQGFQNGFSPRVAARIRYLYEQAGVVNGLLAPLFSIGYFGTTRKRQLTVIILTLMLYVLVSIVSHFPQPWRGIVDAGVVVGLLWGLASLIWCIRQAFRHDDFLAHAELAFVADHKSGSPV